MILSLDESCQSSEWQRATHKSYSGLSIVFQMQLVLVQREPLVSWLLPGTLHIVAKVRAPGYPSLQADQSILTLTPSKVQSTISSYAMQCYPLLPKSQSAGSCYKHACRPRYSDYLTSRIT
jgi:hypothetical protein